MSNKSSLASMFLLVSPVLSMAELPPGFEVVQITDDFHFYDNRPDINECGQIVFDKRMGPWFESEIFLYDNGATLRLTEDNVHDAWPGINNQGDIVWGRDLGSAEVPGVHQVILYSGGQLTVLADNPTGVGASAINDLGHVAWDEFKNQGCGGVDSSLKFFDGQSIVTLIDGGGSHQSPMINNQGEIVWTRYDFCLNPWDSEIMMAAGGAPIRVSSGQLEIQNAGINESSQVVWSGFDGIQLWHPPGMIPEPSDDGHDGTIVDILTVTANNASLNNHGDMSFQLFHEDLDKTQIWTYRGGRFYQLTNDPVVNQFASTNNDWGEIVWRHSAFPQSDLVFMRRVRNGEADFNGFIDRQDHAALVSCLTGPVATDRLCDCRFLDIDHDRDVDLADFARFQNNFGWQAPPDLKNHPPSTAEQP